MGVGDATVQYIERNRDLTNSSNSGHSFRRSAVMVSYNMFLSCPYWLGFFRMLDGRWPVDTFRASLKKSLMCWAFGGTTSSLLFVTYSTSLEYYCMPQRSSGGKVQEPFSLYETLQKDFRAKLPALVTGAGLFWIPNNTLLFYCMPRHLRLLFGNTVSVFWSSFMSWIQHK